MTRVGSGTGSASGSFPAQTRQACKHVAEAQHLIHCHEIYDFPDPMVVRLERVVLLCWRCHDAVHFERTRHRSDQKHIDEIAAHYCAVNDGLSDRAFERDAEKTFRRMLAIRKSYGGPAAAPQIDYGPYQVLIDRYQMKRRRRELDTSDQYDDDEFEMLPDHECPQTTAMWRECFG